MRKHMNRSAGVATLACLMVAITLVAAPRWTSAGTDADLRASVSPDDDAVAIGGGVLTDIGQNSGWHFNPNIELAFGDSRDFVAMSGDFHYDLRNQQRTAVWVGAGPAILMTNRSSGRDDTDLGVNVLTGIGAKHGEVRPFAQLRGTMSDDSRIAIAGGVRF